MRCAPRRVAGNFALGSAEGIRQNPDSKPKPRIYISKGTATRMKPENTVEKIVSAITTLPYDPCNNERARMHQHDGTATPAADPGV